MLNRGKRVAIVTTHPIQYDAPWFRWMAANARFELKVFYLWNPAEGARHDPGFGHDVVWDVPLLDGYEHEFVKNIAAYPGSNRFGGIRNPDLGNRIAEFRPGTALLIGYRYDSLIRLILRPKRRRGFPLMFRGDSHRLGQERSGTLKAKIRRAAIQSIYKRFAAFLYVGQANREYFRMHGVPEESLFFSPHAIDNERFMAGGPEAETEARKWRSDLGICDRHLLILFAGKFEEVKRPLDLLQAFQALDRQDVSLLFVGAGKLEKQMRSAAAGRPNVFFAPFQNQTEMPRTYAACDVFVLPSGSETWGLAINEAFCQSKAVIVSNHVGCAADLVRPLESGLVFRAGDVSALAAALREALSDRARLTKWGVHGREIVMDYDYAHATAGLEQALEFINA